MLMPTESKLGKYKRSIILAFFVSTVLVIGAILGSEVYLRKNHPQTNHYLYEKRNGVIGMKPNLDTSYVLVPWRHRKGQPLPPSIRLITNEAGHRDTKNHDFKKGSGVFRIVNLGNSVGLGYPLALEATYLKKLEASLQNSETINCSILGAGAVQLARLYEKECSQYDADIVIVQLTTSDRGRQSNSLLSDFSPPDFLFERMKSLDSSFLAGGYLYDHFHGVRYLINPRLKKMNIDPRLHSAVPPQPERLEMFRNRTHPTLQAIAAIKNIAKNKNAKFLLLVTPPSNPVRQNVADPDTQAFLTALKSMNIEVINFGEVLSSAGPKASEYYIGWFLNELAHETIARILKEKISKD